MKKLNRAAALALALALCLALAACGGSGDSAEVDIDALAEEMVNAAEFGEPMNKLDSSVATGLYGCAEGTTVAAYAGTGATAEEVAVFDCGSAEAAEAQAEFLTQRNEVRTGQYESYAPAEVPKLQNAYIHQSGQYVAFCVASNPDGAKTAAVNAIG